MAVTFDPLGIYTCTRPIVTFDHLGIYTCTLPIVTFQNFAAQNAATLRVRLHQYLL